MSEFFEEMENDEKSYWQFIQGTPKDGKPMYLCLDEHGRRYVDLETFLEKLKGLEGQVKRENDS